MKFPSIKPHVVIGTALAFTILALFASGCGGGGGGGSSSSAVRFSSPCAPSIGAPSPTDHVLAFLNDRLDRSRSSWDTLKWSMVRQTRKLFGGSIASAATTATISGNVTYEKRLYDANGFTGAFQSPNPPVRYAVVEVVNQNTESVIGAAVTDANGNYTISADISAASSVYVRVLSETDGAYSGSVTIISGGIHARVLNNVSQKALLAPANPAFNVTGGGPFTQNVDVTYASGSAGAFNILDDLISGTDAVINLGGAVPPLVTAYWQKGTNDGTCYVPSNNSLHFCGGGGSPCISGDTDEFDDGVILHEFGHFVADNYSRDDSPGGSHTLDDTTQDIRLSWSEGWATFWSAAVRNDPLLVDTLTYKGSQVAYSYDISGGICTPGGAPKVYWSEDCTSTDPSVPSRKAFSLTTNEMAVSNVLWNIFSPPSGVSFAASDQGMAPIWDVFTTYVKNTTSVEPTIEAFWDGWFSRGYGSLAAMQTIANTYRGMAFYVDASEPNNTSGTAASIPSIPTTLYTSPGAADIDYFSVTLDPGSYTIKTANLTNGADTVITVTGGSTNKTNDNSNGKTYSATCASSCPPNDDSTLASSVSFSVSSRTTYTVLVQRSTSAPPSAGRYGGYDLSVTSP